MAKGSKKAKQKAWLQAFRACFFSVTESCKRINIDRSTYYRWLDNDPDFAKAVEEVKEEKLDFVESRLLQKIAEGDTTAIIFALKSLAKHRGYVERQEIIGPASTAIPPIDIKILLQNPEIRLALETISNQVGDGPKDIKRLG